MNVQIQIQIFTLKLSTLHTYRLFNPNPRDCPFNRLGNNFCETVSWNTAINGKQEIAAADSVLWLKMEG